MRMLNEACKCIDEDWKALKARIQASITGITVNGTTHYQTDGTGICDLGDIKGTDDADEIFMNDGRSVETAVTEDESAIKEIVKTIPGLVQDVAPNAVDNGINIQVTDGNGTIDRMLIRADDSLSFDGLQVGISTKTDGRITEALNTATTAGNKADDAQTDADTALSAATTANTTANTALSKAETAISTANTANSTAETAKTTAETAKTTAETAETTANTANDTANVANSTASSAYQTAVTAKTTAETADGNADTALTTALAGIKGLSPSVAETILNLIATKGDASTETVPLFTAGENLTWDGTTLNASGGGGVSIETFNNYTLTAMLSIMNEGDIALLSATSTASIYLESPKDLAITTGTYGGCMAVSGYTRYSLISSYQGITGGIIVKGSNSYYFVISCNLTHHPMSYNASISIDGADAITASVGIGEGTTQVYYLQLSGNTWSNFMTLDVPLTYEGIRTTVPCRAYLNSGSNTRVSGQVIHRA